jgi:beta-galactosidase
MRFEIINENFILDGKKVFLNSGEIHYFRIKKDLWDTHLAAAKEAGLTTVSTYVPWAWHEPEEKVFDFEGHTLPERDLKGWIEKCKQHGLMCILKPGPFILAEYRGAGLPDWFLDKYTPEVKMHNSNGGVVGSDGVSLFHPDYLNKVTAWYDQIMPLISERELDKGGPVIMMQVCNEIGVFSWLAHQADYNDRVEKKFQQFIKDKNPSIDYWNKLWKTYFPDFEFIQLPPDGRLPYQNTEDRGRDYEWHLFWRRYYGDYLRMLSQMARERGVTLPFYHNLPGWIYGNGYEFPVNITMYEDLFQDRSDIIFGVDHIPEFMSYRNLHDDRIINDITYAMQGRKPLFAAEFQCGSREYHVVTNPTEMELFYKASIANGLTGWNYYMFSQGRNPERKGYSGSTFYWFNPLTPEGVKTNAFPLVQRINKLIHTSENIMVKAKRKAEIAVLFYPPYYATELERPTDANSKVAFNYAAIRRPAYFDGLLKVLQVLNIEYDMLDLNAVTAVELACYKQVWAFATDEMNANEQQKIVDYTHQGGHTVIFPNLPVREMNGSPCTILRQAAQVSSFETYNFDSPLLDIAGFKDIKCANPQMIFNEVDIQHAEIVAQTIDGKICGFRKKLNQGTLTHIGTWLGFDTEAHRDVYSQLVYASGAQTHQATSDNPYLIVRERFTDDASGVLFIGNYYNESHWGNITYKHPQTGEEINIPYEKSATEFPALYGVLTPLAFVLTPELKILHTTSDLLQVSEVPNGFELQVFGNRDLMGEMVLEGTAVSQVKKMFFNNEEIPFKFVNNRILVNYAHVHQMESMLKIEWNEN